MHVRSSLFVNAPRLNLGGASTAAKLAAGAAVCTLLSGCITAPFHDAKVDPRSPIAAEVASTVRPNAAYPTFATFPAAPKDLRPRAQYGVAAKAVETEGARLVKATDDNMWTITDTEGFAAKGKVDAGPAIPPADPADTEAFARDQKARAKSPPPIKR